MFDLSVFEPAASTPGLRKIAQLTLDTAGYYPKSIQRPVNDGNFGPASIAALSKWRTDHGFVLTDHVGSSTVHKRKTGSYLIAGSGHIDADGSPTAYGPNNLGKDYLANAGRPGNWYGIVVDKNGKPIIQGQYNTAPGYYISTTSLQNPKYPVNDTRRYVNSDVIPGCVLPGNRFKKWGMRLGDLVRISRPSLGLEVWAIFHDSGNDDEFGEITLYAASKLLLHADPKTGGADAGILYELFPGTGSGKILLPSECDAAGLEVLEKFGMLTDGNNA